MRITPAAGTLLAFLLLMGCSGAADSDETSADDNAATDQDETPPQELPAWVNAGLTGSLEFPMDRYRISDEDQHTLERAKNALVRQCMADFGYDFEPNEPAEGLSVGPYVYLYGVDHPRLAAEHGYLHPIDLDPRTYAPTPEMELTEDEEFALYGDPELDPVDYPQTLAEAREMNGAELNGEPVPVTGCAGEAALTINAPEEDWIDPTVVFTLENEAAEHANEDVRVSEVLGEWSACMADHGYVTESPLTARDDLGLAGDVSGADAIEAATQDVACKEEVDLVGRWAAVDAEYQAEVIAEQPDLLELYEEQHEERMSQAQAILD